ncbi:hypothetical protein G9A89_005020 [Geosiphon pyriformis]|nr:hypothetical protein G9A89_005020 [Geosiphon pyriformis]
MPYNPIFKLEKISRQSQENDNSPPIQLTIQWGKLTVTSTEEGAQRWSFIPCLLPGFEGGFWIFNLDENLALKHDLFTGSITPHPLDKDDASFVWINTSFKVWSDQREDAITPFQDFNRRITFEIVEIPLGDGSSTFMNQVRLCGDAGAPVNQAWVTIEEPRDESEVESELTVEADEIEELDKTIEEDIKEEVVQQGKQEFVSKKNKKNVVAGAKNFFKLHINKGLRYFVDFL